MECPNKQQNLKKCTCTYTSCSRRGKCCECVFYHRERGELPGCFFKKEAESEYDRSVEFFMDSNK